MSGYVCYSVLITGHVLLRLSNALSEVKRTFNKDYACNQRDRVTLITMFVKNDKGENSEI